MAIDGKTIINKKGHDLQERIRNWEKISKLVKIFPCQSFAVYGMFLLCFQKLYFQNLWQPKKFPFKNYMHEVATMHSIKS